MAKKIKNLERFGTVGWEFTLTNGESYRTNGNGEGLWVFSKSGSMIFNEGEWEPHYEYKQTIGTCDFSLPAERKKAQNKIYRIFRE